MSSPIRFGIIGAGGAARRHVDAIDLADGAVLRAVCGRDLGRASDMARPSGAEPFTSVPAFLASDVQVVVVATPHPSHAELALAAIAAGKHVLIEKPMALTVAACDAIIAAADHAEVVVSVVSQRRWYPAVRAVRDALRAGVIGRPAIAHVSLLDWRAPDYYERSDWRGSREGEGGGVVVNQAVHYLDLVRWFLGPVSSVEASVRNVNHPDIEVEDTVMALIEFRSGAVATLIASVAQQSRQHGRLDLFGTNGESIGLMVDPDLGRLSIGRRVPPYIDAWPATVPGPEKSRRLPAQDANLLAVDQHAQQVADVVHAVRSGGQPLVTGSAGRAATRLMVAIQEAATLKTRIVVEDGD